MDDQDGKAIVNRDDAIPVIRIPSHADDAGIESSDSDATASGTRDKMRDKASGLKERLKDYGATAPSIQDRLFNGLMAQIIPPEELSENEDPSAERQKRPDRRSRTYVDRPNFSVSVMSGNFRRFNSRIGIVFVFQNRLIHLFTWRHPTATLSFLAIYTLLCLNPTLLPLIPLVATLFFVMLPSFLARHPPARNDSQLSPAHYGPPVAPPSRVRPAPELSKDFFRNMRDLQNCMEDFSRLHDLANEYITPYTNFSDEATSSTLYLVLFVLANTAFVASHLIPFQAIALVAGWTAVISGHPSAQRLLLTSSNLSQARHLVEGLQHWLRDWIDRDIVLDAPAEVRQVEIFELQRHHAGSDTWEAWLFSPSPFDPLSPSRIGGARAKGTQFFESVLAPPGWKWRDKKWSLDLWSREWVEGRLITGVEVETEGERWVYDVPDDVVETNGEGNVKQIKRKPVPKSGWEEGTGQEKRGLWRRRRWVRDVERVVVKVSTDQ